VLPIFGPFSVLFVKVSVPASVARVPVVGSVRVVVAVAVSVVLNAPDVASVEPLSSVSVPVVVDIVKPFIEVANAAPNVGVTSVGLVLNTRFVLVVPVVPVADARYCNCVVETVDAIGNPLASLTKARDAVISVSPLTVVPFAA
jgi:hypothetical protein